MALAKKMQMNENVTVEKLLDSILKTSKKASQTHVVFDIYKSGVIKNAE